MKFFLENWSTFAEVMGNKVPGHFIMKHGVYTTISTFSLLLGLPR